MKKRTSPLTDTAIKAAISKAARDGASDRKLSDGNGLPGLHLLVKTTGVQLWRYKFYLHGREGLMALGQYPAVTLAAAREAHRAACALVAAGINPVHARKNERERATLEKKQAERGAFATVLQDWRDTADKHLAPSTVRQRSREIAKHIEPEFKSKSITAITRADLAELLARVEKKTPEVARNLRGYLFQIFEHAIGAGVLNANPMPPARPRRGAQARSRTQVHHAAMDIGRIPGFLAALDASNCNPETRAAMKLVLLTAVRKVEATGARWEEFRLDDAEWLVPAARTKARRPHWVPLSHQAIALLRELHELTGHGEYLFPHRDRAHTPMTGNALNAAMNRIGYGDAATVHGFRSMFSTHFNSQHAHPDVVERCLAHAPENEVRAAYNRHQYADERRQMMQDWADYLDRLSQTAAIAA
ncbi:integrase arm-type DNA-binding domain-containing protein [Burkholderia sp. BCC1047]|uniref:tyrosine-type recombinase/integrase n=1 Tax=Burkholderia sp. BCC1047 TaxID=2676299 RepID=UPI00158AE755|nr:integrase arm-type DNA-binding domain-containing protein [Burkholderia sp. BCC1047]